MSKQQPTTPRALVGLWGASTLLVSVTVLPLAAGCATGRSQPHAAAPYRAPAPTLILASAQHHDDDAPPEISLSALLPQGDFGDVVPDVSGDWLWEISGPAPGGDIKIEREEWHVTQDGARLTGYYDRVVRQVSADGDSYKCNGATEFATVTRYQIRGEMRGPALVVRELGFEIISGSPCDSGQRNLDLYRGLADGTDIRLAWSTGGQILRRARPNVPTQRF